MKPLIALVFGLALTGCTSATKIYDASGQEAMLIECPGSAVPISKCYERAISECPAGYVLLASHESGPQSMTTWTQYGLISSAQSGVTKRIAVRCK